MFPLGYFANSYFAARYWPTVGAVQPDGRYFAPRYWTPLYWPDRGRSAGVTLEAVVSCNVFDIATIDANVTEEATI